MSSTNKVRGGHHRLLWVGLAMIVASLVLALALSLYAAQVTSNLGSQPRPQGGVAQEGADNNLTTARQAVERSLRSYGNPNLEVVEVMEFANNYYAEVGEKDTGIGAMELLVDKNTGAVYPEPGPNMMWNTKYGMMSGRGGYVHMMHGYRSSSAARNSRGNTTGDKMPVGSDRARQIADAYLSRVSPDMQVGEAERFYGYYTLHTEKDGEVAGMLSVNGYSGEVWYHSWHGPLARPLHSRAGRRIATLFT